MTKWNEKITCFKHCPRNIKPGWRGTGLHLVCKKYGDVSLERIMQSDYCAVCMCFDLAAGHCEYPFNSRNRFGGCMYFAQRGDHEAIRKAIYSELLESQGEGGCMTVARSGYRESSE